MTPEVINSVIKPVLPSFDIPFDSMRTLVNPTSRFVIGGPMGDAGLTGRKSL